LSSSYAAAPFRWSLRRCWAIAWKACGAVAIGAAVASIDATAAIAAERVALRLGPFRQAIPLEDLETFAETGEVPQSLRLYSPLMDYNVRHTLNSYLKVDPAVGEVLVADLLNSSAGDRLLAMLGPIVLDSTPEQLRETLITAAQKPGGLSLLGILKSFPDDTVTLDLQAAIVLASEINLPYWQGQSLRSTLERELTVTTEPFHGAFDPTESGYQPINRQTLNLRDRERDRTIPVDIFWSDRAQGPLVVISHGFGADRRFLTYLAEHLASHGISVAAIEHPGSSVTWLNDLALGELDPDERNRDLLPPSEFIDRPKDISFLLDELARLNRYSTSFRGMLNTEQVVVIGHSLGGYTALTLGGAPLNLDHLRAFCNDPSQTALSPSDWLQCGAADLPDQELDFRDERVAAVMAMNPVMGRMFDAASLAQIDVPTLILVGTDDPITPVISQQLVPFTDLQSEKYLLSVIGGTHLSVGDPSNLNAALTQNMFVRERSQSETENLRHMLKGLGLAFVKQLTPEDDLYAPFLDAAYVQSFSNQYLRLRLNRELPEDLPDWMESAAPLEQFVVSTLHKTTKPDETDVLCQSGHCILDKLPLVMLILPGGQLLIAGHQFFRKHRQRRRWRSRPQASEHQRDL
jgi:predicted dienelactone hydrolase